MKRAYNYFLILIVFFLALGAVFFFIENFKSNELYKKQEEQKLKIENMFASAQLQAKAFSIYDITDQKEIYGKNQYERLPIASLAKVMTVLVAFDNYLPEDEIEIYADALNETGDNGLLLNEKWKVEDLAKFSLILSSNDGAKALTQNDELFLEKMNKKAEEIGMNNTVFFNATGLDLNEKTSGAYASAKDVNIMNMKALENYPKIFLDTTFLEMKIKSISGIEHNIKNTNIITDKIPNLFLSKTGFTQLAGGNLSIIFRNKEDHEIAITLLGSTMDGRFSDMEKLVEISYSMIF